MTSRIEQIIQEIQQYMIEECKPYPLSKTKIIVDRERMEAMLRELQMKMPSEIERYRKVLKNRNAILEDAQTKADSMLEDANANIQKLVDDHEIVQMATQQADAVIAEAQERAKRIVKAAEQEAEELKSSALAYVEESLDNLQLLIGNTITTVDGKMKGFMESLQNYYSIIEDNKNEIGQMSKPEQQQPEEDEMPVIEEPIMDEELQFADLSYE